ncbi:ABC transporter permease [[Mycoplasma] gypis]|uniref:ABC transporter permease n=1 Tax=[Mycoplasma] gypis TaxID=92404 RepID=A0ABZ2RQU6_9BACT|nr:ABC transporter permease [[Mycoplasma] gypis]MBN0919652.1 ABC transporter permease [[Mycoplasma] gypis]
MISQILQLTKRNILCFLKDPKRMFFTFMSPFFAIAIFLLFARNIFIRSLPNNLSEDLKNHYADILMIVGVLSTTVLTNSITLSGVMVNDVERKILNDIYITPVKTSTVRFSYLIFNVLLNFVLTLVIFIVCIIILAVNKTLWVNNTLWLTADKFFSFLGLILFGSIVNSSFMSFLLRRVRNTGAFSAISAGLSVLSGFIIGAFVDLSKIPSWIGELFSILPMTQIANLFKLVGLTELPNIHDTTFIHLFGQNIDWWVCFVYAAAATLVVILLTFFSRNKFYATR